MQRPEWAPDGVDISKPNMARSYDYWLGGSHNFAIDREYGRQIMEMMPDVRIVAQANRAFMRRAVTFMLANGVTQFLDIGSGIPTVGNVHEVAQRIRPDARVVYVDIDPIAVTHSQQILSDNDNGDALQQDLCNVDEILNHPTTRRLIDFDQPVGLLMISVLHVVGDDRDPYDRIARYRDAMAPGSFLALTHGTDDTRTEMMHKLRDHSSRTPTPGTLRSREQIERFFTGFDLLEPGVVWMTRWRPDPGDELDEDDERMTFYAGVGRKP